MEKRKDTPNVKCEMKLIWWKQFYLFIFSDGLKVAQDVIYLPILT